MSDGSEKRRGTLLDIAAAVGVSRTTVSNAFNRPDQLSAELRERIMATARAMGVHGPNPAARMLRTGRAEAIGLLFHETLPFAFDDPAAVGMLRGVASACEKARSGLLILPAVKSPASRSAIYRAAVDGFLVYGFLNGAEAWTPLLRRGLPVVAIDNQVPGGVPFVGIDDRGAALRMAQHVLGLGHRRFAIISLESAVDGYVGPLDAARRAKMTFRTSADRLDGYIEAIAAAGIDPASVPVEERPASSETHGRDAALTLLRRDPRPTVILAMSDRLAIGAIEAARSLGLRVPEDVSVAGFDDIPRAALVRPALTTIRQPLFDKGATAARLLLDAVADGAAPPAGRHLLPTELVIRGSTRPPG
ncbi:LacI family DNA-binding transcriptional regulator [Inquilinus limosus]|uniref:LacI family DNA-binding transcriptional regulator n=1 Tax=Inquilinus limosus TaxID=171674 RepID=UPI0004132DDF|nr:LacI family DNA-binding transcriptional regulator [Inquilinus limosus]